MNWNRFAKPVAFAVGFVILCAAPGPTRAQSAPPSPAQTPKLASPGAQARAGAVSLDDFAGLNYSDQQKTEITQIQRDTKAHVDAVVKDEQLNADQKDAMLLGYKRMEYGQIFKVLTPEQQKQVRQKMRAQQASDHTAQKR